MRAEVDALLRQHKHLFAEVFKSVRQYFDDMEQLRKPMTNLEIYDTDWKEVLHFKEGIERAGYYTSFNFDIFRVGQKEAVSCTLNVSPFKTLVEVARVFGYNDRVADLAGLLVGYNPRDIWDYCVKHGIPVVNPSKFRTGQ
jgi:hypothetical protein